MTGKGPKHERETIINFNKENDTASIWTASEVVYRRLLKLGYAPSQDRERDIKLPRPKRVMGEAQRERIRESLKVKRNRGTLAVLPTFGSSLDDAKAE